MRSHATRLERASGFVWSGARELWPFALPAVCSMNRPSRFALENPTAMLLPPLFGGASFIASYRQPAGDQERGVDVGDVGSVNQGEHRRRPPLLGRETAASLEQPDSTSTRAPHWQVTGFRVTCPEVCSCPGLGSRRSARG